MRRGPANYLLRLILFSLFVGTFPVLSLGVFSYYKATETIQEKVNEGNMQILQQNHLRVEQILKSLDNAVTHFINSSFVNGLLQQTLTARDYDKVNSVFEALHRLRTFELTIQEVYLVSLDKNWYIGNKGLYPISDSEINSLKYSSIPAASFWLIENQTSSADAAPSNSYSINLVKKLPINSTDPSGLLIVKISSGEINKLLSGSEGPRELMILNDDYRILAHKDEVMLGRDISAAPYIQELRSGDPSPSGFFKANIDGREVGVSFRKSTYNGWIYLSIVSRKEITKDSRTIGWITFAACMGILALTLIIALQGSRRMYTPIRKLYDSLIGPSDPVNTGKGDELQLIGERIQTLMKTQSQMASQIQGQLGQLKELFVLKLFQGGVKQSEIKDKLSLFGFSPSWRWLCVLTLQIDSLEGTRYEDQDKDLLMFAINNMISELIPVEQRLSPILVNDSQVTLIGDEQESLQQFKEHIYVVAKTIQCTVINYLDLKVSIGISRPYHEFKETPRAYKEGLEALNYAARLGPKAILYIEDVQPGGRLQTVFPEQEEHELIDAIQKANVQKVNELLHLFMQQVFNGNSNHHEYQIYMVRLLIDLIRTLQDSGQSFKTLFAEEKLLFDQLFTLKTREEIENWFRLSIIEPIIQLLENKRESQFKNISDQIIEMIHNDFDTDLTLEICASRLNFHKSYVRRVFRKETGMNFSDYLSQYRLKMAKKWLGETDMKISEIAERLRYNNSQNFIRYFRKEEGITPGQYREMIS